MLNTVFNLATNFETRNCIRLLAETRIIALSRPALGSQQTSVGVQSQSPKPNSQAELTGLSHLRLINNDIKPGERK